MIAIALAYLAASCRRCGAALVDRFLAPRLRFAVRVVVCGAAGALVSPILIMGLLRDPAMAIFFGMPGVVAALVCSLLSGRHAPSVRRQVRSAKSLSP